MGVGAGNFATVQLHHNMGHYPSTDGVDAPLQPASYEAIERHGGVIEGGAHV